MTVYAELLAQAKTFKSTDPLGSYLDSKIVEGADPAQPTASTVADAVHTIAQDGTNRTGGTFALTFKTRAGQEIITAAIAFDATNSTIETAVNVAATGVNAVHTIAQDGTDRTGGTFALTINLETTAGTDVFTTAAIAFNATASTIETAIDVAATAAAVTGWINGAISVSGGVLQSGGAAVVLTFDGAAVVKLNHALTVFDPALLTGGAEPATRMLNTTIGNPTLTGWTNGDVTVAGGVLQSSGAAVTLTFDGSSVTGLAHELTVFDPALLTGGSEPATRMTRTTAGQTQRPAWGFLIAMGVITTTIPVQDEAASATSVTVGAQLVKVPGTIITAVAKEASFEDENNDAYYSIMAALGFKDRAPRVEARTGAEEAVL